MKNLLKRRIVNLLPVVVAASMFFGMNTAMAQASGLVIGVAADITSMDPHFHLYVPNQNLAEHMFEKLITRDALLNLVPGLATSWRALDDLTWEFKLRQNVKFHDGTAFTADDVKFSIERVPTIKDSPGAFTTYTKAISAIEVVDSMTVRFKTVKPHPLMPNDLSIIPIVSKQAATGATSADFNAGKAAIGTGPYKFARYARGDRVELTRNDNYWGKKPAWPAVTFRILTNDASRVAALLAGDVQAIDGVPVSDLPKIRKDPNLTAVAKPSHRLIYLGINQTDSALTQISDKNGIPLTVNPLKDLRVRQALSMAISREAIQGRVMDGAAIPSGQLMASGLPGYIPELKSTSYDPDAARKLLAEAGFPEGFKLTIHGPNNRYLMDDQILQAVAQNFARIGIVTKVEAMPAATFFPRNNKMEFAVSLVGWAPDSGEASSPLRALLATKDSQKGLGNFNVGYTNKNVDELIDRAVTTVATPAREKLLQDATKIAMGDVGIAPLHHQATIWAMRKGVTYFGRADERTYAFDFLLATSPASKP